ncbi:MAG: LruC domain-containing protein [Deltaproteobacteria bacterium]|nr:LruC domain-containing protein [Deltaproteobacteria bacterium]
MRTPLAAAASLLLLAGASRAQTVVVSPNTISGDASLANTNPAVLSILADHGFVSDQFTVSANSTNPSGFSAQASPTATPTSASFALNVEADGNVGQVTYRLDLKGLYDFADGISTYTFGSQDVTIQPASVEPAGVQVSAAEIATVHRITFGDEPTCATPLRVRTAVIDLPEFGLQMIAHTSQTGAPRPVYFLAPNRPEIGALQTQVSVVIGSDDFTDTFNLSFPIDVSPAGDTVIDHCIVIPTGDGDGTLGQLEAPVSLSGHVTGIAPFGNGQVSGRGPNGNERSGTVDPARTPNLLLKNLVPGDWDLYSYLLFDDGPTATTLSLHTRHTIVAGEVNDGGSAWVMDPFTYSGQIRLSDTYVVSHPGAPSSLSAIYVSGNSQDSLFSVSQEGETRLGVILARQDWATSLFHAQYNGTTGDFSGPYAVPVGLPFNLTDLGPSRPTLALHFATEFDGNGFDNYRFFGSPADVADLSKFREGHLTLSDVNQQAIEVPSGGAASVDWNLCVNEVTVQIESATPFINPTITASTTYGGNDLAGAPIAYAAHGSFMGQPTLGVTRLSEAGNWRTHSGTVSFALPPGTWTLSPAVTFVGDDGSTSRGNFVGLSLDLATCGQRVVLVPGLDLTIDPPAACVAPSNGQHLVPLSGTLTATNTSVDRAWYTVNGGAPTDLCNGDCGSTYSATVTLADGQNDLVVYASSSGLSATPQTSESITCDANGCGTGCSTDNQCTPDVIHAPPGLVLFEDLYPSNGDADYNDQSIAYEYTFALDANGAVTQLRASFDALSLGATLDNGFALHLPFVPASALAQGTLFVNGSGGVTVHAEPSASELTVDLTRHTRALFDSAQGYLNTDATKPVSLSHSMTLVLDFAAPLQGFDTGAAPYDLFLTGGADHTRQIHLPEFDGAATGANQSVFGTADDGSTAGRHYVNALGLPFALHIPNANVRWMQERVAIDQGYPDIVGFATSAGAQHKDWYLTNVDQSKTFTSGAGMSAPAPSLPDLGPTLNVCLP